MKAHIHVKISVLKDKKVYNLKPGKNQEIPDEIKDHWYIKALISDNKIVPVKEKSKETVDEPVHDTEVTEESATVPEHPKKTARQKK